MKKTNKKKNLTLTLVIFGTLLLIIAGLTYYLNGLTFMLIGTIGLLLCILVGQFFDKTNSKSKKRKIFKKIAIVILTLGIIGIFAIVAFSAYVVLNAPDFSKELLKKKEVTILYDKDGVEFAKLGSEIRENITYDEASEIFIDALIATEDSRFFQHNGVDIMRFAKATIGQIVSKIIKRGNPGGGSTLTMQVSKNTFTDNTSEGIKGIIRKFTDIYVSIFQLEKNYTKEEIIEFYINNHTLNNGTVSGVQSASLHYFNKDAKDLNLSEAALLAGMYQAPATYDPYYNPKNATARRQTVLNLMVRHGYITKEEAAIAASIPVETLLTGKQKTSNTFQGYINFVCNEIEERYGTNPYTTPMLIYTNMDRKKQEDVTAIFTNNNKSYWLYEKVEGGAVVINTQTGKLEALGSGRNVVARGFSFATDISRQPGSTAKPLFDYAPGMEYNNWSPFTMFDDEKGYTYSNGKPISNYDGKFKGLITLRYALSDSRNIPALKAFQQVDNKKIIDLVTKVGIRPEIDGGRIHEAHAIGAFTGVSPLQLAAAYQMFSNGGYYFKPYSVNKVIFRDTGETDEYEPKKVKVISDSTAFMITSVLRDTASSDNWMRNLRNSIPDIFAFKTGTTNVDQKTKERLGLNGDAIRDTWGVGYTHDTVVSVWLGFDELKSNKAGEYLRYINSDIMLRLNLWSALVKKTFNHDKVGFTQPKSVIKVAVEKGSNPAKLPGPYTPKDQIVEEYFKVGTEPTEISTKYLALKAPTGLSVRYNNNKVTLKWNLVLDEGYLENGEMGYYIYFNDQLVTFTTSTTYVINNLENYIGTYTVCAGYKDTDKYMSAKATYKLEETVEYELKLNDSKSKTFTLGSIIPQKLYNTGILVLTADGVNITNKADIETTIFDPNDQKVTTIDSNNVGIYTISYRVTYKDYTDTISNEVIIESIE